MTVRRLTLIALAAIGAWTLLSFITAPFIGRMLADAGREPTPTPDPEFIRQLLGDIDLWEQELAKEQP